MLGDRCWGEDPLLNPPPGGEETRGIDCDAVAAGGGFVAELFEVGLGGVAVGDGVVGEFVAQVSGQVEGAPLGYAQGVVDGLGDVAEEGRHFVGRFQVEVAVGPALAVGLLEALVVPDGD